MGSYYLQTLQTVHTLGKAVADDPWHVPVVRGALTRNIGAKFDDVREEIVAAFEDEMPATTGMCSDISCMFETHLTVTRMDQTPSDGFHF